MIMDYCCTEQLAIKSIKYKHSDNTCMHNESDAFEYKNGLLQFKLNYTILDSVSISTNLRLILVFLIRAHYFIAKRVVDNNCSRPVSFVLFYAI